MHVKHSYRVAERGQLDGLRTDVPECIERFDWLRASSCDALTLFQRGRVQDLLRFLCSLRLHRTLASEADGAAALARVGATDESAGFGMNHDGVSAAEGFRIAGNNLVASALQFLNCGFRNTRLQTNL
jgi:hypothetical protein